MLTKENSVVQMLQGGKVKVTTFAQKSSFGLVHRIFLKKKKERKKKEGGRGVGGVFQA